MDNKVLRIGGRPLHERLAADLPRLVEAVLRGLVAQIPAYRQLPVEELSGDISQVTRQNLLSFIAVLRSATMPMQHELDFLRESAARRADEGIPIDVVLTGYHVGVQVIWDAITPDVGPSDVADLMTVNALALHYLRLITPAVAAGYLEQRQTIFGDEQSARHTLLSALLDGQPAEEAAGQAGVRLPPSYLVLALAVGPHPDEGVQGIDSSVVARRKLRRLRAVLERRARDSALSALTVDGGTVLLPMATPPELLSAADWVGLTDLTSAMSKAAGADVMVGAAAAEPAEVAAAAKVSREVLEVARSAGKPPGAYRLDDLLLEYQLSRPSAAHERFARLLDPLTESPELLETLGSYLRLGGRRQAATELHVHPNTVDYRLRRVHALTGLDPTKPASIAVLVAALAARSVPASLQQPDRRSSSSG